MIAHCEKMARKAGEKQGAREDQKDRTRVRLCGGPLYSAFLGIVRSNGYLTTYFKLEVEHSVINSCLIGPFPYYLSLT